MMGTSSQVQQILLQVLALRDARAMRLRRINGHHQGLKREMELFEQETVRTAQLLAELELLQSELKTGLPEPITA